MWTWRPAEPTLDQSRSHCCFNSIDADLTSIQWLLSLSGPGVGSVREAPEPNTSSTLASLRQLTPSHVKPRISYTNLIILAIEASGEGKMTLSAIIHWIMENYPYFRSAGQAWQNSIRHRLCTHHFFVKVPKLKTERGRGGYWAINPQYSSLPRRPNKRRNTAVTDQPKVDAVPQATCATTITTTDQAWNPQESEGPVDSGYCSPLMEGHIYETPDFDLMSACKRLDEELACADISPHAVPDSPAQADQISSDLDSIWAEISHMNFLEMDLPDGDDTNEFFTEDILSLI